MNTWKKANLLAKMELRASPQSVLYAFLLFSLLTIIINSSFNYYVENDYVGYDLIFLLTFSVASAIIRPKEFQHKQINDGLYASPLLVMQLQFPIPKDIIIKSRFIVYLTYTLLPTAIMLSLIYVINPEIRETLTPLPYLSFSIIWVAFVFYVGLGLAVSDAGNKLTAKRTVIFAWVTVATLMILLTIFHTLFTFGLVSWSITIAQNQPILAIFTSIALATVGYVVWKKNMLKRMQKIDYM